MPGPRLQVKSRVGPYHDIHVVDPAHKRPLPAGRPLARILRTVFQRQAAELTSRLAQFGHFADEPPRLDHWLQPMVDLCQPIFREYVKASGNEAMRRILAAAMRRQHHRPLGEQSRPEYRRLRGAILGSPKAGAFVELSIKAAPPGLAFNVFRPEVLEFIRHWTYSFCAETNQTALSDVQTAVEQLRARMREGLPLGDAQRQMTRRVQDIFTDPFRAQRIAATECSRAVHGGNQLAAEQSEVVLAKQWLASSDACDFCLELNGTQVPLNENFAVRGSGVYAAIPYAPAHPL